MVLSFYFDAQFGAFEYVEGVYKWTDIPYFGDFDDRDPHEVIESTITGSQSLAASMFDLSKSIYHAGEAERCHVRVVWIDTTLPLALSYSKYNQSYILFAMYCLNSHFLQRIDTTLEKHMIPLQHRIAQSTLSNKLATNLHQSGSEYIFQELWSFRPRQPPLPGDSEEGYFCLEAHPPLLVCSQTGSGAFEKRFLLALLNEVESALYCLPVFSETAPEEVTILPHVLAATAACPVTSLNEYQSLPYNLSSSISHKLSDASWMDVEVKHRTSTEGSKYLEPSKRSIEMDLAQVPQFLVILHTDYSLCLYVGTQKLCTFILSSLPVDQRVIHIYGNIANRFNLMTATHPFTPADGKGETYTHDNAPHLRLNRYRCILNLQPSSWLLRSCMHSLCLTLPEEAAVDLMRLIFVECINPTSSTRTDVNPSVTSFSSHYLEWRAFVHSLCNSLASWVVLSPHYSHFFSPSGGPSASTTTPPCSTPPLGDLEGGERTPEKENYLLRRSQRGESTSSSHISPPSSHGGGSLSLPLLSPRVMATHSSLPFPSHAQISSPRESPSPAETGYYMRTRGMDVSHLKDVTSNGFISASIRKGKEESDYHVGKRRRGETSQKAEEMLAFGSASPLSHPPSLNGTPLPPLKNPEVAAPPLPCIPSLFLKATSRSMNTYFARDEDYLVLNPFLTDASLETHCKLEEPSLSLNSLPFLECRYTNLYGHFGAIFSCLHSLFENLKLSASTDGLSSLGSLLVQMAYALHLDLFIEYYLHELPALVNQFESPLTWGERPLSSLASTSGGKRVYSQPLHPSKKGVMFPPMDAYPKGRVDPLLASLFALRSVPSIFSILETFFNRSLGQILSPSTFTCFPSTRETDLCSFVDKQAVLKRKWELNSMLLQEEQTARLAEKGIEKPPINVSFPRSISTHSLTSLSCKTSSEEDAEATLASTACHRVSPSRKNPILHFIRQKESSLTVFPLKHASSSDEVFPSSSLPPAPPLLRENGPPPPIPEKYSKPPETLSTYATALTASPFFPPVPLPPPEMPPLLPAIEEADPLSTLAILHDYNFPVFPLIYCVIHIYELLSLLSQSYSLSEASLHWKSHPLDASGVLYPFPFKSTTESTYLLLPPPPTVACHPLTLCMTHPMKSVEPWTSVSPLERLLIFLVGTGMRLSRLDQLAMVIQIPIKEYLRALMAFPSADALSSEGLELIGREDLAYMKRMRNDLYVRCTQQSTPYYPHIFNGMMTVPGLSNRSVSIRGRITYLHWGGLCPSSTWLNTMFPNDDRLHRVARLLDSTSVPNILVMVENRDTTTAGQKEILEIIVLTHEQMSVCVGRGAFTLGCLPASMLGNTILDIPHIDTRVRLTPAIPYIEEETLNPPPISPRLSAAAIPPSSVFSSPPPTPFSPLAEAEISLRPLPFSPEEISPPRSPSFEYLNTRIIARDLSRIPLECDHWPEFHNGVAAAFMAAPANNLFEEGDAEAAPASRIIQWVHRHEQVYTANEFGGFLCGMGLRGFLRTFDRTEWVRLLRKYREETVQVGLLLGLAGSLIGSKHRYMKRLCMIHLPSALPENLREVSMRPSTQCAALISLGLIYAGTGDQLIYKTLLEQLMHPPLCSTLQGAPPPLKMHERFMQTFTSEGILPGYMGIHTDGHRNIQKQSVDRESYALCAAWALGCTKLGQQGTLSESTHASLEEDFLFLANFSDWNYASMTRGNTFTAPSPPSALLPFHKVASTTLSLTQTLPSPTRFTQTSLPTPCIPLTIPSSLTDPPQTHRHAYKTKHPALELNPAFLPAVSSLNLYSEKGLPPLSPCSRWISTTKPFGLLRREFFPSSHALPFPHHPSPEVERHPGLDAFSFARKLREGISPEKRNPPEMERPAEITQRDAFMDSHKDALRSPPPFLDNHSQSICSLFASRRPLYLSQCKIFNESINPAEISTAAAMAYGLAYIQTNDPHRAVQLLLPNSPSEIPPVFPHVLFQKVVSRNIILWDSITPTHAWVASQIPLFLRIFPPDRDKTSPSAVCLPYLSWVDISTGRLHGDAKWQNLLERSPIDASIWEKEDLQINIIFCLKLRLYALGGALQSLGLRFAGTANCMAKSLLLTYLSYLRSLASPLTPQGLSKEWPSFVPLTRWSLKKTTSLDALTVYRMVTVCLQALACVMAGTCDREILKELSADRCTIRKAPIPPIHYSDSTSKGSQFDTSLRKYGHHFLWSQAVGILCMGGGQYSFRRDPFAIASLLLSISAFHPPRDPRDQWHLLPACHHLYVLAAEKRSLQAVEITSGRTVRLPIDITVMKDPHRSPLDVSLFSPDAVHALSSTPPPSYFEVPSSPEKPSLADLAPSPPFFLSSHSLPNTLKTQRLRLTLPCLLPEAHRIVSLRVASTRYWPIDVRREPLLPPPTTLCTHSSKKDSSHSPPSFVPPPLSSSIPPNPAASVALSSSFSSPEGSTTGYTRNEVHAFSLPLRKTTMFPFLEYQRKHHVSKESSFLNERDPPPLSPPPRDAWEVLSDTDTYDDEMVLPLPSSSLQAIVFSSSIDIRAVQAGKHTLSLLDTILASGCLVVKRLPACFPHTSEEEEHSFLLASRWGNPPGEAETRMERNTSLLCAIPTEREATVEELEDFQCTLKALIEGTDAQGEFLSHVVLHAISSLEVRDSINDGNDRDTVILRAYLHALSHYSTGFLHPASLLWRNPPPPVSIPGRNLPPSQEEVSPSVSSPTYDAKTLPPPFSKRTPPMKNLLSLQDPLLQEMGHRWKSWHSQVLLSDLRWIQKCILSACFDALPFYFYLKAFVSYPTSSTSCLHPSLSLQITPKDVSTLHLLRLFYESPILPHVRCKNRSQFHLYFSKGEVPSKSVLQSHPTAARPFIASLLSVADIFEVDERLQSFFNAHAHSLLVWQTYYYCYGPLHRLPEGDPLSSPSLKGTTGEAFRSYYGLPLFSQWKYVTHAFPRKFLPFEGITFPLSTIPSSLSFDFYTIASSELRIEAYTLIRNAELHSQPEWLKQQFAHMLVCLYGRSQSLKMVQDIM
ncbi:Proteasome/cyclosome repeat-containing protein [Cardiosporidium cionae]|uniref:Proteasome/cyclosome repeat-containing protein n=1 Tax=Cardiosporidium cionae TaxID=476202 RepID=A0ABQ7JC06_9APIC|nr:Proteasome/cyclosome repeat-containing protein [Cardiosporidium cionae]|eukprot:KAF8821506.1 Proteasome/cyclosome repeat-containing protein [Cardiosporidium cionae]